MQYVEPVSVETRDLADHLRDQLQMLELDPRRRLLCEEIIGNISEDGYLSATADQILESANQWLLSNNPSSRDPDDDDPSTSTTRRTPTTNGNGAALPPGVHPFVLPEFEQALTLIQGLDPAGVGARDLRECLLLQLRDAGDSASLTYRFVDEAFPDLIAHRWNDLARKFGVEPREAQTAADALSRFDPEAGTQVLRPGRRLHHSRPGRRQDRRPLSRLPERHRRAAPAAVTRLPGNRARPRRR